MPWVKLTDDWYDDPALVEAGPVPLMLWPLLITWSARNLTDGRIPIHQVRRLVDWTDLPITADQALAALVDTGRLQSVEGAVVITNYHRYQPTREQVVAQREKDRLRKASRSPSTGNPHGIQTESKQEPEGNPSGIQHAPSPSPEGFSLGQSSGNSRGDPATPDDDGPLPEVPDVVWEHYADLKLQAERQAGKRIAKPGPWKRKTSENARVEHGAQAARWWHLFAISPHHLAACLIDGQAPRNTPFRRDAS